MAGLQRSAVSFRRQGSSGLVWDDKLIQAELLKQATAAAQSEDSSSGAGETKQEIEQDQIPKGSPRLAGSLERSRSSGSGGRAYRTGRVSPAFEPPSPKVSACGFCSAFGKQQEKGRASRPPRHGGAGKMII